MGNLSPIVTGGEVTVGSIVDSFIEASDPVSMQTRLNAALQSELSAGRGLVDLSLCGSGDGTDFVAHLQTSSESTPTVTLIVLVYAATNRVELGNAATKARVDAIAAGYFYYGESFGGAAQGRRFMGAIVAGTAPG